VGELFVAHPVELALADAGVAVDPRETAGEFDAVMASVLGAGCLARPAPAEGTLPGGRAGVHTGALRPLLAELQSVARAYPGATW
jgi:ring-1,2-phenylacetyl-CoA epoxidase subunit PaaC